MMADLVRCPGCGGPGKVERDWQGVENIVCDAYERCGTLPKPDAPDWEWRDYRSGLFWRAQRARPQWERKLASWVGDR